MVCGSHGGRAIIVRGNVRCRGGMWPVVLDLVMSELIVLGLYLSGVYVVGGMAWWGGGSMGASLGVRWGLLSVGVGLCATSKVESTAYSAGKLQWQLPVVSILDSLWLLFEAAFAVLKGLILSTAQVQW